MIRATRLAENGFLKGRSSIAAIRLLRLEINHLDRGPPLWEAAMASGQAGNDPQWDMSQPVPEFEFDQRIAW